MFPLDTDEPQDPPQEITSTGGITLKLSAGQDTQQREEGEPA